MSWKKLVRTDFEAITLKSVLARYFKKKFNTIWPEKCKYFLILVLKELKIYLIYGNSFSYYQIIFIDSISPKSERIWCSFQKNLLLDKIKKLRGCYLCQLITYYCVNLYKPLWGDRAMIFTRVGIFAKLRALKNTRTIMTKR